MEQETVMLSVAAVVVSMAAMAISLLAIRRQNEAMDDSSIRNRKTKTN